MDPNEALAAIRDHIARFLRDDDVDCTAPLEAMHALDGWLARGGFLPDAWRADGHGSLTGNDYLVTDRGCEPDLVEHALPWAMGVSFHIRPETPVMVRLHTADKRAVIRLGGFSDDLDIFADADQVDRLANVLAETRTRLR
jgi:hypothetical protein